MAPLLDFVHHGGLDRVPFRVADQLRGNPLSRVNDGKDKRTLRKDRAAKGEGGNKAGSGRRSSVGAGDHRGGSDRSRDALKSGEPLAQCFTVRSYRFEFAARGYGPDDVRSVRQILGLSQPLFADFLGVDASTVRSWEQGSRPPSAIARRFMDEITVNPDYWRGRLRESIAKGETRSSTTT